MVLASTDSSSKDYYHAQDKHDGFISDFFNSGLAASPELPAFADPSSNVWGMDEIGLSEDSKHATQSWDSFSAHTLSHSSSISSLNSLASGTSSMTPSHGLFLDTPSEQVDLSANYSRNSFGSFEDKPQETLNMWTMPVFPPAGPLQRVPLQINTQDLGRAKITRQRSNSRIQPYYRERSTSVSMCSEEGEEPAALLSTTSTYSSTPWSNPLVTPLNKMSLHHRRTSSNTSAFSQKVSPIRPLLSRAHRSASLALSQRTSFDHFENRLSGTADEREATVRHKLTDKAAEVRSAPPGTQQDKLRTIWVRQWLQLSYTHAIGSTVPRQGLYASYTRSCEEYGVTAINSASFGKAVRNAYPGIKTRRLGHRGNSKYHYVSLRPAIRIEAERLNLYGDSSGQWHVAPEDGSMGFSATDEMDFEGEDIDDAEMEEEDAYAAIRRTSSTVDLRSNSTPFIRPFTSIPSVPFSVAPVYNLGSFPVITDIQLGEAAGAATAFWEALCQHLECLASCTRQLHFDQFEVHCRSFWAQRGPMDMEIAQRFDVSLRIDQAMSTAYSHIVSILIDKLFQPMRPVAQLRALADGFQTIMEQSMQNFSPEFCEPKIELSVRFAHLLQRYTALYQLNIALSPILDDMDQVRSMVFAWGNLDDQSIFDQCALTCECKSEVLSNVLNGFSGWLSDCESRPRRGKQSIEKLSSWIDGVLNGLGEDITRSLVPSVGFLTSQIVRDFTLRSDPAFGLFQLIKTWIDDWVILYVLRKSALHVQTVETPSRMSVMIPAQGHSIEPSDQSTAVPFTLPGQTINVDSGHGMAPSQLLLPTSAHTEMMSTPRAH